MRYNFPFREGSEKKLGFTPTLLVRCMLFILLLMQVEVGRLLKPLCSFLL
jgi:hypothetical protein